VPRPGGVPPDVDEEDVEDWAAPVSGAEPPGGVVPSRLGSGK